MVVKKFPPNIAHRDALAPSFHLPNLTDETGKRDESAMNGKPNGKKRSNPIAASEKLVHNIVDKLQEVRRACGKTTGGCKARSLNVLKAKHGSCGHRVAGSVHTRPGWRIGQVDIVRTVRIAVRVAPIRKARKRINRRIARHVTARARPAHLVQILVEHLRGVAR